MFKLINTIQNYAWGSKTALTELFNIENPNKQPMAELWMGAHPKSSSAIVLKNGQSQVLRDYLASDLVSHLGKDAAEQFGELPFLFKVLCAAEPLSIQVHPNKQNAEAGFLRENQLGIALDSPQRNYKDPNHKPELVYALTPYLAMNAFRTLEDSAALLSQLVDVHPAIADFVNAPTTEQLAILFEQLLRLEGEQKSAAITKLLAVTEQMLSPSSLSNLSPSHQLTWQAVKWIATIYPNDSGLFAPLILNIVQLQPGEAMFLYAQTPHAYLNGTGLEIMANSDNVLRAGLTPKFIDLPELMDNLEFIPHAEDSLLTVNDLNAPITHRNVSGDSKHEYFTVPVNDFAFSVHELIGPNSIISLNQPSAAILFCIEGELEVSQKSEVTGEDQQNKISLKPGESCFVSLSDGEIAISGQGKLARAYY